MTKIFTKSILAAGLILLAKNEVASQITLLQDYTNKSSATIGVFQNITFREAGFSALTAIPNTNGKEFWTISDRGVNVDCASANASATPVGTVGCIPTYDKMFGFPTYAPKIHRVKINGDSVQILQTITMKRPNGSTATGLMNPAGLGSTTLEVVSTQTVSNCANFAANTAAKDIWGIDSEGISVDNDGNFWISEEGGPTIWKLSPNGIVLKRYTPYNNPATAQPEDIAIDTVFKYRKNNRGFECLTIAPNGKVYAIIQSPLLFPNTATGEGTLVHRMIEIDPATNSTRVLVYLNDGIIGASGANQIRLRDWKLGDMAAINNNEFLVIEAAARGTSDFKRVYKINISGATAVTSGLYNGQTVEALVTATALAANNIVPVTKTLFMDLLANSWPAALDKAEGLAIVNDSTIAFCNDNDFGQNCPLNDGIAMPTTNKSHLITYGLKGANKLSAYQPHLTTSVKEQVSNPLSSVSLFPNPVNESVTLSLNLTKDVRLNVVIVDLTGKQVSEVATQNFNAGSQNLTLTTSTLENGIYFVKVSSETSLSVTKIVVMH
ncbi:hypothetical protein CNR22_01410 [Sphingobacteriaceae bacterium]|nr:hypothetical protein CNR22_01410 [Sphingobacteriaceae bacterium]